MSTEPATATVDAEPGAARDPYVDCLRAISLCIVVVWHWAFTMLDWRADGPHATSPLGFTKGFWLATWLFQVMPLFFYIGGFVHLRSWERARAKGIGLGTFVGRRLRELAIPPPACSPSGWRSVPRSAGTRWGSAG